MSHNELPKTTCNCEPIDTCSQTLDYLEWEWESVSEMDGCAYFANDGLARAVGNEYVHCHSFVIREIAFWLCVADTWVL